MRGGGGGQQPPRQQREGPEERARRLAPRVVAVLAKGRNVVFTAPAGWGKSFLAAEVAQKLLARGHVFKVVWVVPTRALSMEILWFLRSRLGRAYIVNKDFPALARELELARAVVTTYGKFHAVLTRYLEVLGDADKVFVVADEAHTVLDRVEGAVTLGLAVSRGSRVLAMTATLSREEAELLARWLHADVVEASDTPAKRILEFHKMSVDVRGAYHVYSAGGVSAEVPAAAHSNPRETGMVLLAAELALKLASQGRRVFLFVPYRRLVELAWTHILQRLGVRDPDPGSDATWAAAERLGVLMHHAGLRRDLYYRVVETIKAKRVRLLVGALAVSQGINMDVDDVVVALHDSIDDKLLRQVVGRAGRFTGTGRVHFLVWSDEEAEMIRERVLGELEANLNIVKPDRAFIVELAESLLVKLRSRDAVARALESSIYATLYREIEEDISWSLDAVEKVYEVSYRGGRLFVPTRLEYHSMRVGLIPDLYAVVASKPEKLTLLHGDDCPHCGGVDIHNLPDLVRFTGKALISYGVEAGDDDVEELVSKGYPESRTRLRDRVASELEKLVTALEASGLKSLAQEVSRGLAHFYSPLDRATTEALIRAGADFKFFRYLAEVCPMGCDGKVLAEHIRFYYDRILGWHRKASRLAAAITS